MKKMASFITIVMIILAGCSNQNLIPKEEASNVINTYGISKFSLTIDTKEQREALTASFTEKKERSEAEYSDKIENINLHGEKALKKIMEAFEKMSPDPEEEETELIKKAADAFGIKEYQKIQLEVTFKGYESKELMFSK